MNANRGEPHQRRVRGVQVRTRWTTTESTARAKMTFGRLWGRGIQGFTGFFFPDERSQIQNPRPWVMQDMSQHSAQSLPELHGSAPDVVYSDDLCEISDPDVVSHRNPRQDSLDSLEEFMRSSDNLMRRSGDDMVRRRRSGIPSKQAEFWREGSAGAGAGGSRDMLYSAAHVRFRLGKQTE